MFVIVCFSYCSGVFLFVVFLVFLVPVTCVDWLRNLDSPSCCLHSRLSINTTIGL